MITIEEFEDLDYRDRINRIGIAYRAGYKHSSSSMPAITRYDKFHPLGDAYMAGYIDGLPSKVYRDYCNGLYNPLQ